MTKDVVNQGERHGAVLTCNEKFTLYNFIAEERSDSAIKLYKVEVNSSTRL